MDHFEVFKAEKNEIITKLKGLKDTVSRLDAVGIDISEDIEKIENAIHSIESDTLRIALLGAFSDGKTSVIAGWLGQIMNNMKIDINESSDELAIYHPDNLPEKCEIIDTPGLFGDKEKQDSQQRVIKFGDITKKYLSEAHLILYVVDATNPLKESHSEIVRWVLKDLCKLNSTIFVINKMDEVADLRDPEDFNNQSVIKKENLTKKLERMVNLTSEEKMALNIVCISSNPNGRGLEFWLDKNDVYQERSRINTLKEVTNSILDSNTINGLIKKTGIDVLKDIISTKIILAEEQFVAINLYSQNLKSDIKRIEEDINAGRREVISAKEDLFNELNDMENNLLGKVRTLSMEDVLPFLEDEIGYSDDDVGYKLRIRIETAGERCFQQTANIMSGISSSIERQLENSEELMNSVTTAALSAATKGLTTLSKMPVNTIKNGVFAARDAIAKITGTVFKFNPWGATKLAANISKWAGPIGAGIQIITDAIGMAQKQKAEEKLLSMQKDISELIKDHFKPVYEILSSNEKIFDDYAPQLKTFQSILDQQKQDLANLAEKEKVLVEVKESFQNSILNKTAVEAEFTVL